MQVRRSVLFTGTSGVGKSAIFLDTLTRLTPTRSLMPVVLNFSAQTSSIATQVRCTTVPLCTRCCGAQNPKPYILKPLGAVGGGQSGEGNGKGETGGFLCI